MISTTATLSRKSYPMGRSQFSKISSCRLVGSFFDCRQLPSDHRAQIAVAGRSNVGKSTLLNVLIGGPKVARVSGTPGKTRSLNFFLVNDRFYLVDLPGYGYAKAPREVRKQLKQLIEDYLTDNDRLAGLVLLLDCRRDMTDEDMQLVAWLTDRALPTLAVVTKTDKLNRDKVGRKVREVQSRLGVTAIAFSATTGVGKKELLGSIMTLISQHNEPTGV